MTDLTPIVITSLTELPMQTVRGIVAAKELCKSCGKKRGVVRCASVTYKSVIMLCYGCAIDLLSTYPNDEKNGLTPADRIYELLCFDNTPTRNLRSKEVYEQPNLFEAQP